MTEVALQRTTAETFARAYTRAFARARKLIYVEDQYFWSDVVAGTLADALRREPDLQVIAVVPRYAEDEGRFGGPPMHYGQRLAYDLLREAGGDRFSMFDLENDAGTPIYVHAKVCIVDDEWMTIGSDNLNLRSWSHDSELTCAVVDPDGELHRRLRTPLWAEHLGLPEDDPRLNDIDDPTALWNERVGAPGSRIHPHEPPEVSSRTARWAGTALPPRHRPRRTAEAAARHLRLLGGPLGVGVGDLAQLHQPLAQLPRELGAEVLGPLLLDSDHDMHGLGRGLAPACGHPDQPRPTVARVGHPLDQALALQRRHQEARGLLGHLRPVGQLGQPRALVGDPLGEPRLRHRDVVPRLAHRALHTLVHRAVGDEHERREVHRIP